MQRFAFGLAVALCTLTTLVGAISSSAKASAPVGGTQAPHRVQTLLVAIGQTRSVEGSAASEIFGIQAQTRQTITSTIPNTATKSLSQADPSGPLTSTSVITGVLDEPAGPVAQTGVGDDPARDAAYSGAINGTVIANRSPLFVRFFIEGATYELDPERSIGLELPRPTAVLNLFNCDANATEQQGCFWDPYLLTQNGFYEVVTGQEAGTLVSLSLRAAGSPPTDQVWIQNRTGRREQVYFIDQMVELGPSTVKEFSIPAGGVGVFYLRTCIATRSESVCEWTAHGVESGRYYALVDESWRNSAADSTVTNVMLRAILGDGMAVIEAPPQMACRVVVPTLNVRSGPGLSFDIIKKVRSAQAGAAIVTVVARTEDSQWLAVDEREADNGWVTSNYNFIRCDGDISALPVAENVAPTPTPAPTATSTPAPQAARPQTTTAGGAAPAATSTPVVETATPTPEPPVAGIPAGYAQVVVNNGFDQVIRFTLDQRHRVELGPSEYDLNPGDSVSFIVYPGQVAFSASTPWRGLSGQTEIYLDKDQSRVLWLSFVPDPGEPGEWILQYE